MAAGPNKTSMNLHKLCWAKEMGNNSVLLPGPFGFPPRHLPIPHPRFSGIHNTGIKTLWKHSTPDLDVSPDSQVSLALAVSLAWHRYNQTACLRILTGWKQGGVGKGAKKTGLARGCRGECCPAGKGGFPAGPAGLHGRSRDVGWR